MCLNHPLFILDEIAISISCLPGPWFQNGKRETTSYCFTSSANILILGTHRKRFLSSVSLSAFVSIAKSPLLPFFTVHSFDRTRDHAVHRSLADGHRCLAVCMCVGKERRGEGRQKRRRRKVIVETQSSVTISPLRLLQHSHSLDSLHTTVISPPVFQLSSPTTKTHTHTFTSPPASRSSFSIICPYLSGTVASPDAFLLVSLLCACQHQAAVDGQTTAGSNKAEERM